MDSDAVALRRIMRIVRDLWKESATGNLCCLCFHCHVIFNVYVYPS